MIAYVVVIGCNTTVAVISDTEMGWTEFHCNRCGNLIGFLNSIDEYIFEIIDDETLLCTQCIALKN